MLKARTSSIRYTTPYPMEAALALARAICPGRERHIREAYRLVEAHGGIVWDCEPYDHLWRIHVELVGGEEHPAWPELLRLSDVVDSSCEICGEPGEEGEWWVRCASCGPRT